MSRLLHSSRAALLLLALLSTVVLGDASRESCAMHGGGAVVVVLGATARIGEGGAAQMASHEMHAQHQEHQSGEEHQGQGSEDEACHCSCIGDGSAAVVAAILPATLTLRVATIEAQPRHVVNAQTSELPTPSAERRLPFANGPPATRLA